jgi:hypothetical protein
LLLKPELAVESHTRDSFMHTACACRRPPLRLATRRRAPTEFVVGKNYRLQDIQLSKNRGRPVGVRVGADVPARRTLVENTGLEPVTSWLQTRRSPS